MGSEVRVLRVRGTSADWGFRAEHVRGVIEQDDWAGRDPIDPARFTGIDAAVSLPRRVLVAAARTGEIALEVRGPIDVVSIDLDALSPLPAIVIAGRSANVEVAFVEAGRAVLLFDPDEWGSLSRGADP
jgi:hypothetical protein